MDIGADYIEDNKSHVMIKQDKVFYPMLDYARVFAALLVIYAHLCPNIPYVHNLIYSFHMPLFFIISGMLYKGWRGFDVMLKRIFIPFLTYSIIYLLVRIPFLICSHSNIVEYVKTTFLLGNIKAFVHTSQFSAVTVWFLVALAYCWIINYCWGKVAPGATTVVCLILFVSIYLKVKLPFYLSQGAYCFVFFQIGNVYKDKILYFVSHKYALYFFPILLVLWIIGVALNGCIDIMWWHLGKLPVGINLFVSILVACIGSLLVFLIFSKFSYRKWIRLLADSLISIMGLQFVFIYPYKQFIGYYQGGWISLMYAITILILCYVVHCALCKYVPYLIGK